MTQPFRRKRMVWLALIGAMAAVLIVLVATQPRRAELLTHAPGTPHARLAFLNGPVRSTLQNLRSKLFGPPRPVAISAEIFECHPSFAPAKDSLPAPVAVDEASTRLWLLDTNQLNLLRGGLRSNVTDIARPSVYTAEGHPAKIFVGESFLLGGTWQQTGIAFDVSARARGSEVDLAMFIMLTTAITNSLALTNLISIRTNLAVGARVEIQPDQQLFLLTSNAANGKRIGVIVSAPVRESKK